MGNDRFEGSRDDDAHEVSPSCLTTVGIAISVAAVNALLMLIVCGLVMRALLPPMPSFPAEDLFRLWSFSTFVTLMVSAIFVEKPKPVAVDGTGIQYLGKVLFVALALSALGTFASLGPVRALDLASAWRWAFESPAYLVITTYFMVTATLGHLAFRWVLKWLKTQIRE